MDKNNETKQNTEGKRPEFIKQTLLEMSTMVDNKLKNIKTFTPILLTIVTSVIAFLFVTNIDVESNSIYVLFWALGGLLLSFVFMIVSFFGKNYYKNTNKRKNKETIKFEPHKFHSYCYLTDSKFVKEMGNFANRDLTEEELLSVNFLKQKINECIYRRRWTNIALGIVEAGAIILIVASFIGPFVLQGILQI